MPHYVGSFPASSVAVPVTEQFVKYNCRVKYFPENRIKISCFSKPILNPCKAEAYGKPVKQLESDLKEYDPESGEMVYKFIEGKTIECPFTGKIVPLAPFKEPKDKDKPIRTDSMKRAIDKAFEIGLANNFRYFITLTLDETKIDRYDKDIICKKLGTWLNDRTKRNAMDYIIFPEYHKKKKGEENPAIHFHGLINAENLKLTDSGKKTKSGQTIYNLDNWKFGFSTVIELDGRANVVTYVTKYITKGNVRIFGKFYLSGGRTLKRELPTEFLNIDYANFEGQEYRIPAANMSVKYKTYSLNSDFSDIGGGEPVATS